MQLDCLPCNLVKPVKRCCDIELKDICALGLEVGDLVERTPTRCGDGLVPALQSREGEVAPKTSPDNVEYPSASARTIGTAYATYEVPVMSQTSCFVDMSFKARGVQVSEVCGTGR